MAQTTAMIKSPLFHDKRSLVAVGKVREIHSIDDQSLLFVTTDKISAFDVVLKNGVPGKGEILTMLSRFWFEYLNGQMPGLRTHFISMGLPQSLRDVLSSQEVEQLENRSMKVRRLKVFPIESIVRGYITGSAWSSYQKDGTVNGTKLPAGLLESQKFPEPLWTPSTKAELGAKDENISAEEAANLIGKGFAEQIASLSLQLYKKANDYATNRGIIIADTKFEFAIDTSTDPSSVVLVDEVLTPDSSRFWSVEKYEIGRSQESLDKQPLRDWLASNGKKGVEGVEMPEEVVQSTERRYREAYKMIVGSDLSAH